MKYFLDTEFHEEPGILDLISLGIVAENGSEWYGVSGWFNTDRCNPWVKKNVLPHLHDPRKMVHGFVPSLDTFPHRKNMAHALMKFFDGDKNPEFWGYYSDYDWVAFCQIFGRMVDLPDHFPNFCLDIKQIMHQHNITRSGLPAAFKPAHNALVDARWTKAAYEHLKRECWA
jgi:hypothetical protein